MKDRVWRWARRGKQGAHRRDTWGHTLIELLLVCVLFSLVTASALSVLAGQWRFHAVELQVISARDAARLALEVLAAELRVVSPGAGDLYAIATDSVALRSYTGFGFVCGVEGRAIGVRKLAGTFGAALNDSVLVFVGDGRSPVGDGAWAAARVGTARQAAAGRCPDGAPPDAVLVTDWAVGGVVGGPVRAFRPYVYRLYRGGDGHWWLGRRLRGGRIQPVTGPFADPTAGGLRLEFRGRTGQPTAEARAVTQVGISVRALSPRPVPGKRGPELFHDSLSTVVFLRNSAIGDAGRLGCPAPGSREGAGS